MSTKSGPRPGGRSARIQAAVHQAVRDLENEIGREALTVPAVAVRAGVTPSTIYRRWGDLTALLSDVAVENLRPETDPANTGSLRGDLESWVGQYLEEMSSELGRKMIRDVLANGGGQGNACQCAAFTRQQVEAIHHRAEARGDPSPGGDALMDRIVAPLMYRILFSTEAPDEAVARKLVHQALAEG